MHGAAKATIWAAAITTVGAMITGIIVAEINKKHDDPTNTTKSPGPTPTHTTAPSIPPPVPRTSIPPAVLNVAIDQILPRGSHKAVSASQGFTAKGTVKNLPSGYTIWLMDEDQYGYTVDSQAAVSGGSWTAASYPVGNQGAALPFLMRAVVVVADAKCGPVLRHADSSGNDDLDGLPAGCREVDGRDVSVRER
jgi:hypothetical protein